MSTGPICSAQECRELVAYRCGELEPTGDMELLQRAAAEIERLWKVRGEWERKFAILEAKLPKTADGVPVVPGMTVYWLYPTARSEGRESCWASGRVRYVEITAPGDCRNLFVYPIKVETDNGKPNLRGCYSTREAAEATNKTRKEPDVNEPDNAA